MGPERGDLADRGCGFDASVFSGPGGIGSSSSRVAGRGGPRTGRWFAVRLAKRLEEADPSARAAHGARSGGRLAAPGALATGFAAVTPTGAWSILETCPSGTGPRRAPEESADSTVDGLRTERRACACASGRLVECERRIACGSRLRGGLRRATGRRLVRARDGSVPAYCAASARESAPPGGPDPARRRDHPDLSSGRRGSAQGQPSRIGTHLRSAATSSARS